MNQLIGYLDMFWPFLILIVVFYFFMYRPQKKQEKERAHFLRSLKKGDHVVTAGGIHGVLRLIREKYVLLEISPKTVIKIDKTAIVRGDVRLAEEEPEEKEESRKEEGAEEAPEAAEEKKEEKA